ncbi:MAG: NAD-dependent epimerase/dehydratase family protein [Deltaproteobacteria bacterium]|nr:NAD-dependent epimerase/dehydratase family protein [Deltaproteobacteria bacterium]
MKRALVCGAGGCIGVNMVARLKAEGYWVRGVDVRPDSPGQSWCDEFLVCDLRRGDKCVAAFCGRQFDEVYQFAADMGGAGYIFTGENDATVMHNSAQINLNVLQCCRIMQASKVLFTSSACIYPKENQTNPDQPNCQESSAYPANPDSDYGWEKLFSERLYFAYMRNFGIDAKVMRLHNVFGPYGAWTGGRDKAPAALCRKVIAAKNGGAIEMWGDGKQTRSFLYVEEAVEGLLRMMQSDFHGPVNLGSEEMVTMDEFVAMVCKVADKQVSINHISGPVGVRGRNSDNRLIKEKLKWAPSRPLIHGIAKTYRWIETQYAAKQQGAA